MSASISQVSHALFGVVLVMMLGVGLPGCGQSSPSQGEATPDAPASPSAEPQAPDLQPGEDVEEEGPTLVTAAATLQLSRIEPSDSAGELRQTEQPSAGSMLPMVLTECHHLQSDLTIQRLLDTEAVRQTGWYQGQVDQTTANGVMLDHVLEAVHVEGTTLVRVSATTESGEDALAILQAWIGVYLQAVDSRAESRCFTDREAFQRQLEAIEADIQNIEARIRRHLTDQPAGETADRIDAATRELLFLDAKKREIDAFLVAAEAAHRALLARNAEPYEPSPDEVQMISLSLPIQQIDAQIRQLRVSREVLLDGGLDEMDPQVEEITVQIQALESERLTEFDNQVRDLYNAKVEAAAQSAAVYREQSVLFAPRIEALRARLEALEAAAAEFETIQRELDQFELRRDEARQRIQDLDVLIRRSGGYIMEVHTPPAIVEP
ncbi:MAG: hypothetical protein AAGA29_00210 [Planctomycetota bacterium]